MNRHALEVLEFERVLETIAERAATAMGRERVLALRPAVKAGPMRDELARVAEAHQLLQSNPNWSPPKFPNARTALDALQVEGGVLDPADVLLFRDLLGSSRQLSDQLIGLGEHARTRDSDGLLSASTAAPHLSHIAALRARLPVRKNIHNRLSALVDEEGAIRDDASASLRGIRRRLRSVRGTIVRRLETYMLTLPAAHRVEGASVSVREGRLVIPIRREGKAKVGGIIRGESGTGATLFVEPPLAIRLMNEVDGLERDEAREIHRMLKEVTNQLRPLRQELDNGFEAQIDLDSLWARALAARAWDAAVPELIEAEGDELAIVHARHPLLVEKGGEIVPFSLELGAEERVVVVSGPNTGGKTVLLKALGLIHLLAQSGVIPPVGAGTRLPILRDVFADIGDGQSISESLSTFSAHIENAREILANAGQGTLVLMDELGTGTDPAEGAALARVILQALVRSGARGLVTSHLGALKRLDAEGSGILNASLLFDAQRLAPTFQLHKGRPGRSFGLAIARRLGFPTELLDRAAGYVGSDELKLEDLLQTLESREQELADALEEAHVAGADATRKRAAAEAHQATLEARERALEARAREQARSLLLEARQ